MLPRAIRDAVQAAAEGERVAYFANSQAEAREAFLDLVKSNIFEDIDVQIRRSYGEERIEFRGAGDGTLYFLSANGTGMRGRIFDRALAPWSTSNEKLTQIFPCLVTTDGLLTLYVTPR